MRAILLLLLVFPMGSRAQFGGSTGRGDAAVRFQTAPITSSIFSGSTGRGDVAASYQPSPVASTIFGGSNGRGDGAGLFQSTPITSSIFSGSNGRGDVAIAFGIRVNVALRGYLEGPYSTGTGWMSDALRVPGLLPLTEPYTALGYAHTNGGGGETIPLALLSVTGANALVDWVLVELRSASAPATVIASRSALLQRDGDVVDIDGVGPVLFNVNPASYHVALRHRNHLGVMTATAMPFSASPVTVDFTNPAMGTFGSNARKTIAGTPPAQALWAGDVTFNGEVKYTGSSNDRDPILVTVGSTTPNNVVSIYSARDVNMDGTVKYTGSGNDRDPILVNVGSTTPNTVRPQQLP